MTSRTLRILGILFATALLVAACGDDDDTTAATADDSTVDDGSGGEDDATGDEGAAGDDDATGEDGAAGEEDTAGDAQAAPVQESETDLGTILVDADGLTLYAFTPDEGGTPTCTDACADVWPPVFTDGPDLPDGLDGSVFSVVDHPSGQPQLAAGGWPLYRYASDAAPGDVTGQGVGGSWFVVAPDGSLVGAPAGTGAAQTGSSAPGEAGY